MALTRKKGDETGMQTRTWGPAGWIFLHSIAQNYPWKPTEEQKYSYYSFFNLVGNVLPCRYCRESYQKFIHEPDTELTMKSMESRKSLFLWLYKIHNKVNKKLDVKGVPTKEQVWEKYESFRAKCHKSPEKIDKPKKGCFDPMKGYRKKCVIRIVDVDENGNEFGSEFGKKQSTSVKPKKKKKKKTSKEKVEETVPEERVQETVPEETVENVTPDEPIRFEIEEEDIQRAMEVLGVTDKNDVNDIRRKYKLLAIRNHPDRGGDSNVFKKISEAKEILMEINGTKFGKAKQRKRKAKQSNLKRKVKQSNLKRDLLYLIKKVK
jgi:hypothetical protein